MKKKLIQYSIKFTLIFVITLSFFACQTLHLVAEAQDDFNDGAEIENATKFSQNEENNLRIDFANTKYASALSKVKKALSNKNKLKESKIYGSALTIKALCELELGLYDQARLTSLEAEDYLSDMNQPRDLAINVSMEGLIKAKKANDLLTKYSTYNEVAQRMAITSDQYEEIKSLTTSGIANINTASKPLNKDDILKYFAIYKANMIDVWALADIRNGLQNSTEVTVEKTLIIAELKKQLTCESPIFKYYRDEFHVSENICDE